MISASVYEQLARSKKLLLLSTALDNARSGTARSIPSPQSPPSNPDALAWHVAPTKPDAADFDPNFDLGFGPLPTEEER